MLPFFAVNKIGQHHTQTLSLLCVINFKVLAGVQGLIAKSMEDFVPVTVYACQLVVRGLELEGACTYALILLRFTI